MSFLDKISDAIKNNEDKFKAVKLISDIGIFAMTGDATKGLSVMKMVKEQNEKSGRYPAEKNGFVINYKMPYPLPCAMCGHTTYTTINASTLVWCPKCKDFLYVQPYR